MRPCDLRVETLQYLGGMKCVRRVPVNKYHAIINPGSVADFSVVIPPVPPVLLLLLTPDSVPT
jgi:hypothetical protein